ncbi:mitochondrial ATP synthase epsilon chain-domain-containing protein [Glomus cerebriforme]|uniref:Mitochondrial ATP synthase epsilon chain-domain-containing protein n=1 Tax=Glomus cerebriforme TaxID=658196 RepID=A0A397TNB2_9GLOM|nr:mitochondrial ATP synthase epsilon chain-domain-containing protein [Glomus cerebriforme]
MAFTWKSAGITYLKYTQICARAVRNALKEEERLIAQKRDEQGIKFAKWENGKQGDLKLVETQQQSS